MKGLIIIPDITGFTNFVKNINIDTGVFITTELLNSIIENNTLGLTIAEIEGDAILFYKLGNPLAPAQIFDGLKIMYEAFNDKLNTLKNLFNLTATLSLKFIVHYGDVNVYNIKGFKKLFGQTVIEAHCLLKNGNGRTNYILLTNDYISASPNFTWHTATNWAYTSSHSTMLAGLRTIDYSFYTYAA